MADETPAGFAKAYLELFEASGSSGGGGERILFQFNPKEFQVVKKAKWESKPTKGNKKAPPPEYIGPEAASMSLEMFLDAYDNEGRDVSKEIQKLVDACTPTATSESSQTPKPPGVIFGWDKVYFKGYIESVTAKYTRFDQKGRPVRATCTIAMKEFPKEVPKQNPTSGALAAMGSRQVVAGDTLPGIAYREYGDSTLWRALAEANRIDDPMSLAPGTRLLVPAATEAVDHR
ncbi:MAG: phage tail protein [Actinomycetota bacterium]